MEPLISVTCSQGFRPYMEDTFIVNQLSGPGGTKLLCVFDGHGGDKVALLCKERFSDIVAKHIRQFPDVSVSLRRAFEEMDDLAKSQPSNMGCTALACLLHKNRIWMANCGDSLAMAVFNDGRTVLMSVEHKVEHEKERIQKAGGRVTYDDGCARINQMLNVARSIGDYHLKQYVISTPFITSASRNNIKYIVLASDGVWDVYNKDTLSADIDTLIQEGKNHAIPLKEIVDGIGHTIVRRCYEKRSTDNITFIFCCLQAL